MATNLTGCRTLLFLCTGNYYRSRFAEFLFNDLARQAAASWTSHSCGLALERGVRNIGPISPHAAQGLANRGIWLPETLRYPVQVQEQDLQAADLIVALSRAEHRSLVEQRFPRWPEQIEYWHIDDLNVAPADEALAGIEREVRRLLQRLA